MNGGRPVPSMAEFAIALLKETPLQTGEPVNTVTFPRAAARHAIAGNRVTLLNRQCANDCGESASPLPLASTPAAAAYGT
jgi:hypothetical protein